MARHEIDAAVMSLSPPGVFFGDQQLANELARMVNEPIAQLVTAAPDRFAGLAFLPLPFISSALEELPHALDVLNLDGVALLSNIARTYHGGPAWDPLWVELERRGAYVMLHPTAPPHELPLPQHPIWLYEFPFETTRAIVNLIYSGTLEQIVFGTDRPYADLPLDGDPAPTLDVLGAGRELVDARNALALVPRLAGS